MHSMYMARTNVTIPDQLLDRARVEGLNVSGLASSAIAEELERREKISALGRYLDQLDRELGPVPVEEQDEARAWVEGLRGEVGNFRSSSPATRMTSGL